MKKKYLKRIAQMGYTIGYAANLNFATYDIVKKLPNRIAFLSIVVGVVGLSWPELTTNLVSTTMIVLGVAGVYIERFAPEIDSYGARGKATIGLFNKLCNLYYEVKTMDENADFLSVDGRMTSIQQTFNDNSEPNQIAFSNWYAHYKFFCEKDVSWMDEQLHFSLWKDKIPQSAKVFLLLLLMAIIAYCCFAIIEWNDFSITNLFLR